MVKQVLGRFIVTAKTAKHRVFTFVAADLIPDSKLYTFAIDDGFTLGVLSTRFHCSWALATGALLEDRPTYNNTTCFEAFPFPDATDAQIERIRALAEALDAHRKAVQAAHPDVTLTGMYNGLVRLREATAGGPPLTEQERALHERALIGTLRTYHDDLDAAVADAYGWPVDLPDDQILERLVALNAQRADEESRGTVRWLRPDFQAGQFAVPKGQQQFMHEVLPVVPAGVTQKPWPKTTYDQIKAIRDLLAATAGTLSTTDVAVSFVGAPPAAVRRHLEALEAMGFVVAYGDGKARCWHASPSQVSGASAPA